MAPGRSTASARTASASAPTSTGCRSISVADAITTLGANVKDGFVTYHVMNPHDDGIGIDEYVDWLIEAGYPITRIDDFGQWVQRFHLGLTMLPEDKRHNTVLQMLLILLHTTPDLHAPEPTTGASAPTDRFRVGPGRRIGPDGDIPHVTPEVITKIRHRPSSSWDCSSNPAGSTGSRQPRRSTSPT